MSAPSCRRLANKSRTTLRFAALRMAGVCWLLTQFWAGRRAQIVGSGARQAAFRAAPTLTCGVMREHGWRYHNERLDRAVHPSPRTLAPEH